MEQEVIEFISLLRETANNDMVKIFTRGGCYRLYLILKSRFPDAKSYKIKFSDTQNNYPFHHVVTKIGGNYFDINGICDSHLEVLPMDEDDIKIAERFKYPVLQKSDLVERDRLLNMKSIILRILRYLSLVIISIGGILGYRTFVSSFKDIQAELLLSLIIPIVYLVIRQKLSFDILSWKHNLMDFSQISFFLFEFMGIFHLQYYNAFLNCIIIIWAAKFLIKEFLYKNTLEIFERT